MHREGRLARILAELTEPAADTDELVERLARYERPLVIPTGGGKRYVRSPERQVRDYLATDLHNLKSRGLVEWDCLHRGNANPLRRDIRRTDRGSTVLEEAS